MRYFVTIAGRTVEVDLSGPEPVVDGVPLPARLAEISGTRVRHLMVGVESHALIAEPGERSGAWRLTLRGRTVLAEVVDERTRAIRSMIGSAAVAEKNVVTAPMPGLVVRIPAEVGQTVTAGEGLIVVEAMKMENELKAPAGGVVVSIEVVPGQPVEKGTVLIVLE
jgi:acetyl/propionyl-CoA carboxylase alpha subunit